MKTICVIGAGKMGLPLACQFAHRGGRVLACDKNSHVVDRINKGLCSIDEPGIPELLHKAVREGRLIATTNVVAAVAESSIVIVIVPAVLTPNFEADLSNLEEVSSKIAGSLTRQTLVSYETTVPVGTTRGRLLPILESRGLKGGEDFYLVFSPERIKSNKVLDGLKRVPKIIGGVNPVSSSIAVEFYRTYLGATPINVGALEAAEFVKLAGMAYRDVNIALANELANYAQVVNVDMSALIEHANSDGESAILQPGLGVGGHCTPVYPYFLIHDGVRRNSPITLAERSRHLNDWQSKRILDLLEMHWGKLRGRRVLTLGLCFRPDVKEDICSTAYLLREELKVRGAVALIHDPLYSNGELSDRGFESGDLEAPAEILILNTAHRAYHNLDFRRLHASGVKAVVDGRNLWDPATVREAGVFYLGIGRPFERQSAEIIESPPKALKLAA